MVYLCDIHLIVTDYYKFVESKREEQGRNKPECDIFNGDLRQKSKSLAIQISFPDVGYIQHTNKEDETLFAVDKYRLDWPGMNVRTHNLFL